MQTTQAQKLEKKDVFMFTGRFFGRLVELTLKDDSILKGRIGDFCYPCEFSDEDDEMNEEVGFSLKYVELNGEVIPNSIKISQSLIKSFIPLERENTQEEIKALA